MMQLLRRICATLARMLYWGWVMRNSHDWDHSELLRLELRKLERMLACFESPKSYHDESCKSYAPKMKSLRLAIKLGQRYLADEYYKPTIRIKFDTVRGPMANVTGVAWIDEDTGLPATKERLEALRAEFDRAECRQERDRRLFYDIIKTYGTYWWD